MRGAARADGRLALPRFRATGHRGLLWAWGVVRRCKEKIAEEINRGGALGVGRRGFAMG